MNTHHMINKTSDPNINIPWPANLLVVNRTNKANLMVPLTVNKADASLQPTAENVDASVQLRWTDDKAHASVQSS